MRAFRVDFRCYLVAEDAPAAQTSADSLRTLCASRGFQPGAGSVREVSSEELSRIPALMREVERRTRPMFGPVASDAEREAVLRAIAAVAGGDAGIASSTVHAVELAHGYLPKTVALSLIEKYAPRPDAEAVA